MSHRFIYPEVAQAAAAAGHFLLNILDEKLSGNRTATLAISGGSSPKAMFDGMAKTPFDWSKVHIFWVDERAVPPTDDQSNYKMALQHLIEPARIPVQNIHRIHAELPPAEAAQRYVDDITQFFDLKPGELPHFDAVHRGMGPDAHTASLFPGEPLIEDRDQIAAAVYVEKFHQWRITLLPGPLLAAGHTAMFVTGEDKAEKVNAVFNAPYDPMQYPSQMTAHLGRSVTWFFDQAAARLLE